MKEKKTILARVRELFYQPETVVVQTPKQEANYGTPGTAFSMSFNGETSMGGFGPAIDYTLDYTTLRIRSWQAYLESELPRTIISKYVGWVVANGLRLKANPNAQVLAMNGVGTKPEDFNEEVESLWELWSRKTMADHSRKQSLVGLAQQAYLNAKVGGDVLVVLRLDDNNNVTVQLIDGEHVSSPIGSGFAGDGTRWLNGIKVDKQGRHLSYMVKTGLNSTTEIAAYSKQYPFLRTAFMVYGLRHRLDNQRGIPLLTSVLETVKKLERYKEATVGSAEEQAKVAYQVVHQVGSTGTNPLGTLQHVIAAAGNSVQNDNPINQEGEAIANKVIGTTQKQAFNMPVGSKLETLQVSGGTFHFKEFYDSNTDIVCSAAGIPPNVAKSVYNDSFSASRAATKDWEHTLKVQREDFAEQFYKPIYEFFLHIQILLNNVQAPGYLEAVAKGKNMLVAAYQAAAFDGPMFPHIDPVKEVKAVRELLGPEFDNVPLITVEDAAAVFGGDGDAIRRQASEEQKDAIKLGFKPPVDPSTTQAAQKQAANIAAKVKELLEMDEVD